MRSLLLFICILTVFTGKTLACDCNYMGSFLKVAPNAPMTALIKVTKYLSFKDIYDKPTPMSMEVEIIEVYKGTETRKTVTVWGDQGNSCRPYLSRFKEGEYYFIAFMRAGRGANEHKADYAISVCGAYWLTADINNKTATGDINSDNQSNSTMKLEELRTLLNK